MFSYFIVGAVALVVGFALGGITAEALDDYEYYDFFEEDEENE